MHGQMQLKWYLSLWSASPQSSPSLDIYIIIYKVYFNSFLMLWLCDSIHDTLLLGYYCRDGSCSFCCQSRRRTIITNNCKSWSAAGQQVFIDEAPHGTKLLASFTLLGPWWAPRYHRSSNWMLSLPAHRPVTVTRADAHLWSLDLPSTMMALHRPFRSAECVVGIT